VLKLGFVPVNRFSGLLPDAINVNFPKLYWLFLDTTIYSIN